MGSQKKGRAFIRVRSSWERYERDKKEEKWNKIILYNF